MQARNLPYALERAIVKEEITAAAPSHRSKPERSTPSLQLQPSRTRGRSCRPREESRCPMGRASGAAIHGSQSSVPRRDRGKATLARVQRGETRIHYKVGHLGARRMGCIRPVVI
ncbi:hypothetical protein FIBSPDRAFT_316287 [Athelia psychrophila]|uniref:Uncharacterized protein n=1 Tax=Athelia psychrophila TaxID=1759441 RepID=A0A167WYA3_9AGAM|nr:hypothetical protein FIBSPDRAFT_316287 [Fibularhizoctonia sp. CBS 109695]